jgi:hypothetical protein
VAHSVFSDACRSHEDWGDMNFGTDPYDVAYLLAAPTAALLSLGLERRWLVFLAAAAMVGWVLEFGAENWVDAQWMTLIERTPDPSRELIQQFNSDGASKAETLLFGLPIAAVYAAMWFGVIYGARRLIRSRGRLRKS